MLLPWGFGTVLRSRLGGWKVACLESCAGKVVITWVLGNLSVAIDSGPLGQESANIWVVKGGVEVLDPPA